ncbi:MFS transporter [Pseudoxanthomonas winnipegensis]|uniref:MFS transporter n=1 Tax=Pseudoxanthomonas winnipegensis TaxID=2480810 RepID=A0A4Q8L6A9_9GAMM|nr:MFS transporter [Pseudoxanthomonas winnipegensis]TAA23292.1 MFS transporter [Pseudoxanthomonas winnipegensis]
MNASIAEASGPDARRWIALVVLLTGTLLPPLDFFIVNVALPAIRDDLHASPDVSQLVVSVYATAYAVTLVLGGRLGDILGRKRTFLAGMVGFGVASALCGLAPSAEVLVAGRLLQGVSAAVMAPQSLAFIHALFQASEKNRALSLYGATFGLASAAGQLLGGVLVAASPWGLGWRSVFLVNLPVIAVAIPAALVLLPERKAADPERLDLAGAALLALGLLALVVPLIEGRERGWPWWCLGALALAPLLLFVFWRYQNARERSGGSPLVSPSALSSPALRRTLVATLFFYALAAFFLIFSVYQQAGLHHGPLAAGIAILPVGVGLLLGALSGPRVAQRLHARTAAFAMSLEATGLTIAAVLVAFAKPAWLPLPLALIGIGQGIAHPALVRLNVDQVEERWAGLAAGVVSAVLQISAALSVALVGGVFFAMVPDGASAEAVAHGFAVAALLIAAALAIAALLSWPREPRDARGARGVRESA